MTNYNFFVNENGDQVTFTAGAALVAGYIKFSTTNTVINTSANDDHVDGYVTNAYDSGATNVTVYKKTAHVRLPYDGTLVAGNKVTASGTTAGACKECEVGERIRGTVTAVYNDFAMVWMENEGILNIAGTNADTQTLEGAGAVNVTSDTTLLVTTGADALTLADGTDKQEKTIIMITDGGDGTLTPSNFGNGTTITFGDAGDAVKLKFVNDAWYLISNNGAVVA